MNLQLNIIKKDYRNIKEENEILDYFKGKHYNLRKTWDVPDSFPDEEVINAYKYPKVDKNNEKFSFGIPKLIKFQKFCKY